MRDKTQPRTILLVEDEAIIAMQEARQLEKEGYAVVVACSGEEAVATVQAAVPPIDLILMDIDLGRGRMDGARTAECILQARDIPIVFLSSHIDPDIVARADQITSYGYVVKGTGITVLAAAIRMAFKLHAALRSLQSAKERLEQEITERRRADQSLSHSQHLLRETAGIGRVGGWELDIDTLEQTWTDEVYRIHEVEPDFRPTVEKGFAFYAPDAQPVIGQAVRRAIELGEPFDVELPLTTAKGNHRWVRAIGEVDMEHRRVHGFFQDVTQRHMAEENVRRNERRFRAIFEQAGLGVAEIASESGRFLSVNRKYCDLVGYTPEEMLRQTFADITHPGDLQADLDNMGRLLRGEISDFTMEKRYCRKNGEVIWVSLTVSQLWPDQADCKGRTHLAIVEDISERKRVEEKSRESEVRLRLSAEAANVGFWDWDLPTNQVFFSPEWKRQIGYGDEEIPNRFDEWQNRVHPDDLEPTLRKVRAFIADPRGWHEAEFRFRHKDGSYRWIHTQANVISNAEGKPTRMLGCHLDITERRLAEAALGQSLAEKNLLMHELQHRVKNSLVVAASMINLEKSEQTDARARLAFDSVESRIRSMAAVYEQLCDTGGIDRIRLDKYVGQLVARLSESYVAKSSPVKIETRLEEVHVELKRALSLGIILNELVINSMKHAFPPGRTPREEDRKIRVELSMADGEGRLIVSDNGVGLPPEKPRSGGAGLKLVGMLTRQVDGSFSLEGSEGCVARMTFRMEP